MLKKVIVIGMAIMTLFAFTGCSFVGNEEPTYTGECLGYYITDNHGNVIDDGTGTVNDVMERVDAVYYSPDPMNNR